MLSDYQIELRHYRYFLAVAEELHFRKAAERLYISQPGLSRQIKAMEEALGFQLFVRTRQKVALTPSGVYLKAELHKIFHSLDNMISESKMIHTGEKGEIRLGYVGSAMQETIPNLLKEFTEKHPGIHFSLNETDNFSQIHQLQNHKLDLGFLRLNEAPKDIEIIPIRRETFSLVVPQDFSDDVFHREGFRSLEKTPFILFEKTYSPTYYDRVMSIFEEASFVPIVSHRSIHAATIFRLVEMGLGLSIVPTSLSQGYSMDVKFIELDTIPQRAVLFAAWLKRNRNPALGKILALLPGVVG